MILPRKPVKGLYTGTVVGTNDNQRRDLNVQKNNYWHNCYVWVSDLFT